MDICDLSITIFMVSSLIAGYDRPSASKVTLKDVSKFSRDQTTTELMVNHLPKYVSPLWKVLWNNRYSVSFTQCRTGHFYFVCVLVFMFIYSCHGCINTLVIQFTFLKIDYHVINSSSQHFNFMLSSINTVEPPLTQSNITQYYIKWTGH